MNVIVKIDGDKIRQQRESKGLTQLYLATVVGVTTDTISRWENKKYPTIKKINAEKLAEALEVPLEAILEDEPPEEEIEAEVSSPEPDDPARPEEPRATINFKILLPAALLVLTLVIIVIYGILWKNKNGAALDIVAQRTLPRHITPGQPFPVIIEILSNHHTQVPIILKEQLPPEVTALEGSPPFTSVGKKNGEIKWIRKIEPGITSFFFLAQTRPEVSDGLSVPFKGSVTRNVGRKTTAAIKGDTATVTSVYHWADTNSDNMIDDEEILAVYDRYSSSKIMEDNIAAIENYWSENGYVWNQKTKKFEVVPIP